jgi:hypothetical protein
MERGEERTNMANFTIRVELRGNPSAEEYEKLHALMAQLGYGRTVAGIDNEGTPVTVALPHATYFGSSSSSVGDVRNSMGNRIKQSIQNNIVLFVAQTETWAAW